ncbi:putative serine/threonine protein kinase [Kitasatospora setae KM-6054]|uniref:Putative serine/threonine protein kinase n=2 Tax=Kitasatospora setae TaxID=2066 RepID=E4N7W4_KITSK|nr:putative serine/threonine protein kinase [Kitasatospora setae KM-6054]
MMRLRREDPRIVGPYRLHRRLGAGGMGVVYLGSDRKGQRVALKLIRAELAEDAEFRTRFAREIAAASRIRGGCTARVVGSDIEADRPWLATAYVPGPSLYKQVSEEGPMAWADAARIGSALADGLVKVHEAGVVHRDLKPSNILLSPKGPRIIDFGIAWSRGASTLTHVGTAVGSPGFLAPEQVRGAAVTPATDVFAFGATLAFALTGESPFGSGASSEVMLYRVVHEEPDLTGIPPVLAPLVRACLAKEPSERPPAAALHERLSELAARGGSGGGRAGRAAAAAAGRVDEAGAPAAPAAPAAHVEEAEARPVRPGAAAGGGVRPGAAGGRPVAGGRPAGSRAESGRPAAKADGPGGPGGRAVAAPAMPRQDAARPAARPGGPGGRHPARDGDTVRERRPAHLGQRTPVPGRDRTPPPGRVPHTLGGRPTPRQRLLRQRLVVFVTVTLGVALAIAVAQGCENRDAQGLAPRPDTVVTGQAGQTGQAAGTALSVDGAGATGHAETGLAPSLGTPPQVDWPNLSYTDPSGGPAIRLRDGHSTEGGPPVSLAAVLPARYRDAQAALVVLRRLEGAVPVDLVQLYGFTGGAPVLIADRASAANPEAGAVWRVENGALIREEKVDRTGAVSSTRYTVRADGGLEESWPGSGVSGSAR